MQLVFCSVSCWDSHVATLRHRDAWAVEARAPTRAAAAAGEGSAVNDYPEPAAPSVPRSEAPTQPLGRPTMGGATIASPGGSPSALTSPPRRIVSPGAPAASGGPVSSSPAAPSPAMTAGAGAPTLSSAFEREVLIVVSKMKKYIKERSGMNTSDAVAEDLSEHVRAICDDAIRAAAADGRKTVLDRDVPRPRR